MMLAKNCWIVSTLVAATAAGHAAAQGGAVAKGATEPLDFKPADARMSMGSGLNAVSFHGVRASMGSGLAMMHLLDWKT